MKKWFLSEKKIWFLREKRFVTENEKIDGLAETPSPPKRNNSVKRDDFFSDSPLGAIVTLCDKKANYGVGADVILVAP